MSFIVVELHCKSGGFTRDVHLFVCSFIYRLKRVLVGHWRDWCSSAVATALSDNTPVRPMAAGAYQHVPFTPH